MVKPIAKALFEEDKSPEQLAIHRTVIRIILQVRLGSLPPPLNERIEAVTDVTMLHNLFHQALRAERLDDLQFEKPIDL